MHTLKASLQYAKGSLGNEMKEKYLDERNARIDPQEMDLPKPLNPSHPLAEQNLKFTKILKFMENDVLKMEDENYLAFIETLSLNSKSTKPIIPNDQASKKSQELLEKHHLNIKPSSPPKSGRKSPMKGGSVTDTPSKKGKLPISKEIIGTYIKDITSPRIPLDNKKKEEKAQNNPIKDYKKIQSLNSLKTKSFPTKKTEQNMMMFKEIFVDPRTKRLEELHHKDVTELIENNNLKSKIQQSIQEKNKLIALKNVEINASNIENKSLHEVKHSSAEAYRKVSPTNRIKIPQSPKLEALLQEEDDLNSPHNLQDDVYNFNEIIKIVMKKFNSVKGKKCGESFFSQQIPVQTPEGLNATIAAPLAPGSGWAPSIPSFTGNALKSSLQDLKMRAKAGVQAGDIQKEAHMSFFLGVMNEDTKKYTDSIKFYKRFFFCARLLDDPVGASLALNRLGVVYFKSKRYEKSQQFHKKHKEFADKDNIFIANYNLGICYRFLNKYEESLEHLKESLNWSLDRMDYESECISLGQMGLVYLINNQFEESLSSFKGCFEICQKMRNNRLQLDCLLCIAYVSFAQERFDDAKDYFEAGLRVNSFSAQGS